MNQSIHQKRFDKIKKKIIEIHGDVYDYVSEYRGTCEKLTVRHKECGYEWDTWIHHLKRKRDDGSAPCPLCSGKARHTKSLVQKWIDEIHPKGEYLVLEEPVNNYTPVLIRHTTCGYEWKTMTKNLLDGKGCRKCAGIAPYTNEEFQQVVNELSNGQYVVLSDYINSHSPVILKHLSCGNNFEVTPAYFLHSGSRCPHCFCSASKGERRILDYLKAHNIRHEIEYTFESCRNTKALPFDFAILDGSGRVISLIEFDGKQHFEPVDWFGGEIGFAAQKRRDEIKNEYCAKKGIPLLRIPYWDYDNIESILDQHLASLNGRFFHAQNSAQSI